MYHYFYFFDTLTASSILYKLTCSSTPRHDVMNPALVLSFVLVYSATTSALFQPRLLHGEAALRRQFPFVVSITTGDDTHICGGTILSATWILTAASCFSSDYDELFVHPDIVNLNDESDMYPVKRIITHPEYNSHSGVKNIALLELDGFLYDAADLLADVVNIRPIALGDIDDNEALVVVGWGSSENAQSGELNYLDYTSIYSYDVCTESDEFICALPRQQDRGVCLDDMGGPVIDNTGRVPTLVGIVTHRSKDCSRAMIERFTRVITHLHWILHETHLILVEKKL